MSTTAGMNVEIDPAIQADPELLRDVRAATAYLDTMHEFTEPPALVRWSLAADQPARPDHRPAVVVMLRDLPEFAEYAATSDPLSRVRTKDANPRERAVIRVWAELLRNRSSVLRARTASLIADAGGQDGD